MHACRHTWTKSYPASSVVFVIFSVDCLIKLYLCTSRHYLLDGLKVGEYEDELNCRQTKQSISRCLASVHSRSFCFLFSFSGVMHFRVSALTSIVILHFRLKITHRNNIHFLFLLPYVIYQGCV